MKAALQASVLRNYGLDVKIAPGAKITVKDSDSGLPIDLWGDRFGTIQGANPFFADSAGHFLVFANPLTVNVSVVADGYSREIEYVPLIVNGGDFVDYTTLDAFESSLSSGIPEWTIDFDYPVHSFAIGSDGTLYRSQVTPNEGNDPTLDDGSNWIPYHSDYLFERVRHVTGLNETKPVHQWRVNGADANIDIALSPKGNGAITANVPDGTWVGGDKRGEYAIDLQLLRYSESHVASGNYSVSIGGGANTASGMYSIAAGGFLSIAEGNYSFVGGGQSCRATGDFSVTPGGLANIASGDYSYATGRNANARDLYGKAVHSSGGFAISGDAQIGTHVLIRITTSDESGPTTADGEETAGAQNVSVLPNNGAHAIVARVIAREPTTGDVLHAVIEGTATRGADAASTAIVGDPVYTIISRSAGAADWDIELSADTTLGAAIVSVTGEAGKTIRWVTKFDTVEGG